MKKILFHITSHGESRLDQLFATAYQWPQIAPDGAKMAAQKILQAL